MLKVNVGLSRKVSRDFNSTGFSINLEGEVCAPLDDPELVIEKVRELYDLAEESLNQQVERYEEESAIASRDEPPAKNHQQPQHAVRNGNGLPRNGATARNGNDRQNSRPGTDSPPATNKQIQYLLTLGKRLRFRSAPFLFG